jgi:hypothetical protein
MATSTCIIIFLCLAPVMYAMYRGLAVKASFKVWIAQFSFETKALDSSGSRTGDTTGPQLPGGRESPSPPA